MQSGPEKVIEYGLKYDSVHGKREDVSKLKMEFGKYGDTKSKAF